MGYDMYICNAPESMSEEESYFRLNIFGMRWAREQMDSRNMIFWTEEPAWPEYPGEFVYQYKDPEFYADKAPLTPGQIIASKKYTEACDAIRRWHGPEIPGIPGHKFCSNDGWVVLPAECEAAVRIAGDAQPPAEHPDIWQRWIAFMNRARQYGGFEVW